MPIHFTCPHCGQETLVEDQFVGQSGPCATCGKTVTVPFVPGVMPKPSSEPLTTSSTTQTIVPPATRGLSVGVITAIVLACLFCLIAVVGLITSLVIPAVNVAQRNAASNQSAANLRQIATALNAYADRYGTYPPAHIVDKTGRPIHSWRVLILPFLGHQKLYDDYDLSQTWDSPQNNRVSYQMPEVFVHPADRSAGVYNESSYMVILGKRTMFPYDKSVARDQISDGLSNTIMVVEVETTGVNWLDPVDLDSELMQFQINNGLAGLDIGNAAGRGANVATADGQVHSLSNSTLPEHVENMTTIDRSDRTPPQF